MAGDWIKMRVWLSRDPRVISMADFLACERAVMDWLTDPVRQSCKDSAYSHVTRHVMVALCVTGLLVTWGTAREQGDRIGDDLVMRHCDFSILDGMTDIPCFGEALAFVGWARETDDGSVVFPKFFKDNESPDDRHRRQAAERQANKRRRDAEKTSPKSNDESNVISHVTVTHREEKRREEEKELVTPNGVTCPQAADPPPASSADCPAQRIVDLYHEKLPELPRCEKLTPMRRGYLRQRWREDLETLDDWVAFFADVRKSDFLMGKRPGRDGRPPFRADLEWLTRPANYAKFIEGKYHRAA